MLLKSQLPVDFMSFPMEWPSSSPLIHCSHCRTFFSFLAYSKWNIWTYNQGSHSMGAVTDPLADVPLIPAGSSTAVFDRCEPINKYITHENPMAVVVPAPTSEITRTRSTITTDSLYLQPNVFHPPLLDCPTVYIMFSRVTTTPLSSLSPQQVTYQGP